MEYVTTRWRKVAIGIDLLIEKLDKKSVYMAMFITQTETDYRLIIKALRFYDGVWTIVENEGFILHGIRYICKCPIQPKVTNGKM